MKKIQPKIYKVALKLNPDYFLKYCFFALRKELKIQDNKNEGMIITSTIFCLNKDTTDSELAKFYKDFNNNYSDTVFDQPDFNVVQRYRINQNIEIQYYTGNQKKTSEAPQFFTSFAEEGMTLNKSKDHDPTQVKHSFRFDQVVDCAGNAAGPLKKVIDPELADEYRQDDCCVSYLLNWDGKGSKTMICSTFKEIWKCKVEIKIIRSTMFDFCMRGRLSDFFRSRKAGKKILNLRVPLIERLANIEVMNLMFTFNLKTYPNDNSFEYKLYEMQSKRNKQDYIDNVIRLDYELASPGKKSGGCQEYIDDGK